MQRRTSVSTSFVLALAAAVLPGQGPQRVTPAQVGINYDLVAVKMPMPPDPIDTDFQDAFNNSVFIGAGAELVLIHPDGSEEVLFSAGPQASVVDPSVSYDGRTVYFSLFEDPRNRNPQRLLSLRPAHIWKINVATRRATQLTFGNEVAWRDSANQIDPRYALFDVAPVELPDGRILFLSTRDGNHALTGPWPSPAFWRMNPDGSNLERMEWFSMAGCQHPIVLKDGRIVWTHRHDAGRRAPTGAHTYPLMIADQDLSNFKSFAGMHFPLSSWHFLTQMPDEDIVVTAYYHLNSCGHGPLVRFPLHSGHPSGNDFGPVMQNPGVYQVNGYGLNDSYPRVGESLVTPWTTTLYWEPLTQDRPSKLLPSGIRAGKTTMPAALPGGDLVFVWSAGETHIRSFPWFPDMKVAFIQGGMAQQHGDMKILKEEAGYQYMHPRPLVPYSAVHGVPRPARQLDVANDGSIPELPAGGAFATTGTSSVYNRESHWPPAYTDEWSQRLTNSFPQMLAHYTVGQDSYRFSNDEIHAAQVVVDMARVDSRNQNLRSDIISHNNGQQLWAVLGEVELRKFDAQGQPILDPNGDPDTSYEVRIPANVPFHHRLVDKNGLMLTAEWTWHSTRPGERKTNCGGCHAHSTEVPPLEFSRTAAANPGYPITDFALQTPMVDQDAQGNPAIVVRPEKQWLIEYYKDVKPILDAKCVSCHQGMQPAGGLDLAPSDAWRTLAYGPDPAVPEPSGHQATRYVRKNAATQSFLVWKVYGQRLDGRTNAERNNDWDYTGEIMPPPSSGVPALTFAEKRTIGLWVDLGCLVDRSPGQPVVSDPYDDQMKPSLVVSGVATDYNEFPLPPLVVSAFDMHSGLNTSSLNVVVTPAGGQPSANLAAGVQLVEGMPVSISLPPLPPDQRHTIDIDVADQAGNVSRRKLEVTPLTLRHTQASWARGSIGTLRVEGAQPNEVVFFLGSLTGPGPGPGIAGFRLDLLPPIYDLGLGLANPSGIAEQRYFLPINLPPFVLHSQAVVLRGASSPIVLKSRPLWIELK